MMETVLMRTFATLYSSDFEGDADNRPYKSGKCSSAERRAFTLLSSVCWSWWRTITGFPESPTAHWVKHQLVKLIECEFAQIT